MFSNDATNVYKGLNLLYSQSISLIVFFFFSIGNNNNSDQRVLFHSLLDIFSLYTFRTLTLSD